MALPAKNFLAPLLKHIYYKKTMALLAKTIKLKNIYIYIYIDIIHTISIHRRNIRAAFNPVSFGIAETTRIQRCFYNIYMR
jgi:hypothetical protein